jgi:hypothetical protein
MGYGTTKVNITKMKITSSAGNISTETLRELIMPSEEFVLKKYEFMYFKVNYVKIILFPSQPLVVNATEQLGNDVPINRANYIYFNWAKNDTNISTGQLVNSDNSKIVSCYLTRNKVFTFIPPNFTYNSSSGSINPTSFTDTEFNDYPGFIKFLFYNTMEIRIEINITFRGSRDLNIDSLTSNLLKLDIVNKIKEDKKLGIAKAENKENKVENKSKKKKKEIMENSDSEEF